MVSTLEEDAENGRLEQIQKEKVPVVFMNQPKEFFQVPADRLQEWERLLKERIGIPESVRFSLPNRQVAGVSCCPHCDDCCVFEM